MIRLALAILFYAGIGVLLRRRLTWGRIAALAGLCVVLETGLVFLLLESIEHFPAAASGAADMILASGWMPWGGPDTPLFAVLPIWLVTSFASIWASLVMGWKASTALRRNQ